MEKRRQPRLTAPTMLVAVDRIKIYPPIPVNVCSNVAARAIIDQSNLLSGGGF